MHALWQWSPLPIRNGCRYPRSPQSCECHGAQLCAVYSAVSSWETVPAKRKKKKTKTLEIDQFGRVRKMYNYFNFLERASGMGRGIQK